MIPFVTLRLESIFRSFVRSISISFWTAFSALFVVFFFLSTHSLSTHFYIGIVFTLTFWICLSSDIAIPKLLIGAECTCLCFSISLFLSLSSLFLSVSMSIKRAARSRVRSRLLRSRTSSFLEINFLIIYIEGGDEVNCKPVEELLSTFCSYYHRCFLRRAWKGLMHPFLFPFSFFFVSHARWESQIEQPDCVLNCRLSLWSSPDIRGS